MIVCEYYSATFQEPTTCIKKQIRLRELLKNNKNNKNIKNIKNRKWTLCNTLPEAEYYSLLGCINCKIGKKLYNEWRKNNKKNKNTKTPICSNYGTLVKKEEPIELYTKQAIRTRGGL